MCWLLDAFGRNNNKIYFVIFSLFSKFKRWTTYQMHNNKQQWFNVSKRYFGYLYVGHNEQLNWKDSPPHSSQFVILKKTEIYRKRLLVYIVCLELYEKWFKINKGILVMNKKLCSFWCWVEDCLQKKIHFKELVSFGKLNARMIGTKLVFFQKKKKLQ